MLQFVFGIKIRADQNGVSRKAMVIARCQSIAKNQKGAKPTYFCHEPPLARELRVASLVSFILPIRYIYCMSTKYKFRNPEGLYFVTFAVVAWVDVFTRRTYRDILLESFEFAAQNKGLAIHAYVIMSNHVHIIMSRKNHNVFLENIMRDMKKYSAFRILKEIREHSQESRREWMLDIFKKHGIKNSNNRHYQFWRQDNHPIELDPHSNMFAERLHYIHQNPVEAGLVENAVDYLYSSARDYEGKEGLLEVEVLEY